MEKHQSEKRNRFYSFDACANDCLCLPLNSFAKVVDNTTEIWLKELLLLFASKPIQGSNIFIKIPKKKLQKSFQLSGRKEENHGCRDNEGKYLENLILPTQSINSQLPLKRYLQLCLHLSILNYQYATGRKKCMPVCTAKRGGWWLYVFMHHGLDIAADTSALNPTSWLTGY